VGTGKSRERARPTRQQLRKPQSDADRTRTEPARGALGYGPNPAVTLAQAREKAAQLHFELRDPETRQRLSNIVRPRRLSKAPAPRPP
jgi:hypothetical protein